MGKNRPCSAGFASARRRLIGRAILLSVLASIGVLASCVHQGDLRLTYVRSTTPSPLIRAVQAGTYDLIAEGSTTPKFSIELAPGDKYGFRQREDDAIVAVAKDKEIELGDRFVPSYSWVRRPTQDSK